jgi:parallel beta-helix repeat protein
VAVALQACGGGGGQPNTPPAANTPTRGVNTPVSGTQTPVSNTPTPVPDTPTATPTAVHPGNDLRTALRNAPPGSTVLVAPGTYPALVLQPGDLQGPVTLLADIAGVSESIGAVTIDGHQQTAAAISITGVNDLTIDGVTVQGGTQEGILVLDSPGTVLRNCIIRNNSGDGIFIERAAGSLVFDNLVYQNTDAGIRLFGSNDARVINNTVYKNGGFGIFVGIASEPSTAVTIENNIINANTGKGIQVETNTGYFGDYNLNTNGYGTGAPAGAHDLNASPQFIAPDQGDFHLLTQLDDCTGGSPAINAGDPATSADLVAILQQRSTRSDGVFDCVGSRCCIGPPPDFVDLQPGQVDLGYHYAVRPPTPTPAPRSTPTRVPTATRPPGTPGTPTATRTQTPTRPPGTPGTPTATRTQTATRPPGTPGTPTVTPTQTPTRTPTTTPTSNGRKPTPTPRPTITPRGASVVE